MEEVEIWGTVVSVLTFYSVKTVRIMMTPKFGF